MRQRSPRFESLESRRVLSGSPLVSAPASEPVALLRYIEDGELVLNSDSGERQVHQSWPRDDIANDWAPTFAADFSGDGITDVLGQLPNGEAWLQVNDGQQLYLVPWGQGLPPSTDLVGTGDVNNDGLLDVVSFNQSTNELWVSLNDWESGFSRQLWGIWSTDDWSHVFVGDFDGDGFSDVLGGGASGEWRLAKSNGQSFQNQDWGPFPVFDWLDVVTGEFDGDGFVDVAARASDNTWWMWQGTETGLSAATYWGHWKMQSTWHDLSVADFNADGIDDVVGRSEDGRLWVGTGTPAGFQTWSWATGWIHRANWQTIEIADVVGDALPDQIGQASDGTWWAAENVGGKFRNQYLGRYQQDVEFVATVRDFELDSASDISSAFQRGRSSASQHLADPEELAQLKNIGAYATLVVSLRDSSSSVEDPEPTLEPNQSNEVQANDVEPIKVSLDDDGRFVIQQTSTRAHALRIESPTRSLVPRSSPAPFEKFLVNDPGLVLLIGDHVAFTEDVVLDVGWTESSSGDRLTIDFVNENSRWQAAELFGERTSSSKQVEKATPDFANESDNPLVVSLNEDNFFVITGEGQSVPALNLKSSTAGLIPGTSPNPFEFFVANSPQQVTIGTWGSFVTIDGSITLDIRWDDEVDLSKLVVEYGGANAAVLAAVLDV